MPRTKPADERRADLLDAAEAVFVDKGVSTSTLEDITQRAGVAKGSFYLHFRSKDDIVRTLQYRFGRRFAARITTATAGEPDWAAKLDAFVTASFANYAAQYELHDVLFHHGGPAIPTSGDEQEFTTESAIVATIRELLADGVAAGAYRIDDLDVTAMLLYGAIHGAFEADFHTARSTPESRLTHATRQLFRRAAGLPDPDIERPRPDGR